MHARFAATLSFALLLGSASLAPALLADEWTDKVNSLESGEASARRTDIAALRDNKKDSYDAVVAGLKHKAAAVREECARLLGVIGTAESVNALSPLLVKAPLPDPAAAPDAPKPVGEESDSVRATALTALSQIAKAAKSEALTANVAALARPLAAESVTPAFLRYAAVSALADAALDADHALMSALLTPAGSPALGERAVYYLGRISTEAGFAELLSFLDTTKDVGEGAAKKTIWAYEDAAKSWAQARTAASCILVAAKHKEGVRLLLAEAQRNNRSGSAVTDLFAVLAANYGEQIGDQLVTFLWDQSVKVAHSVSAESQTVIGMLPKCGPGIVAKLVKAADDGEAQRAVKAGEHKVRIEELIKSREKEIAELDIKIAAADAAAKVTLEQQKSQVTANLTANRAEIARIGTNPEQFGMNPFEAIFDRSLDELAKSSVTRAALGDAYANRPEPAEGKKDAVKEKLFQKVLSAKTPESLAAVEKGFASPDKNTVISALNSWFDIQAGSGIDRVRPLLTHKEKMVREHLATKLNDGRVPEFRAQPLLLELTKDAEPSVAKLAWSGLGRCTDPALLSEFERGMTAANVEVAYQASQTLQSYCNQLKLSDKKNVAHRTKAIELVMAALKRGGPSACAMIDFAGSYLFSVFTGTTDEKDAYLKACRELATSTDAEIRCAVGEKMGSDLYTEDLLKTVREQFLKEETEIAACGQLQGLQAKLASITDEAQLDALIPRAIYWLAFNDAKKTYVPGQTRVAGQAAASLLSTISKQKDNAKKARVLDAVRQAVRAAVDLRKSPTFPPESDPAARRRHMLTVGFGMETWMQMTHGDEVDLVLEASEAFDDASIVANHVFSYLKSYAGKAHRERINSPAFKGLTPSQKAQITAEIDKRIAAEAAKK